MVFKETKLKGTFLIELERHADSRGFFARSWCAKEFEDHGLNSKLAQCSVSFNARKGTLRGMHFQAPPFLEAKVVRCTQGVLYDVVIDLRRESPTYKQWVGFELSAENRNMLYVGEGCAHGFLTRADGTEIFYQISEFYKPDLSRGVRWNDPAFGIVWPAEPEVMSDRDRAYADFS